MKDKGRILITTTWQTIRPCVECSSLSFYQKSTQSNSLVTEGRMVGSSRDNNKKENHHSSNDLMLSKSSHVILVCAPYSSSYVKKHTQLTQGDSKSYIHLTCSAHAKMVNLLSSFTSCRYVNKSVRCHRMYRACKRVTAIPLQQANIFCGSLQRRKSVSQWI